MIRRSPPRRTVPYRAFSLVELLVVIGIIALLAGILFPTISKVRAGAQQADSQSFLNQIDQACQAYYTDFKAYPGPFSYTMLNSQDQTAAGTTSVYSSDPTQSSPAATVINDNALGMYGTGGAGSYSSATFGATGTRITGAENLLLGLCGGLAVDRSVTPNRFYFDATAVGSGPQSFNPIRPGKTTAYLQPSSISKGRITNDAGTTTGVDSIIPEFQDRFSTPMPILYMRSRNQGRFDNASPESLVINTMLVASNDYNIVEIQPYTSYPTGAGSTVKPTEYKGYTGSFNVATPHGLRTCNRATTVDKDNKLLGVQYTYPYDAYDYLVEPSSYDRTQATSTIAASMIKQSRKKDSYVLISAGKDRIYGTADDITNFGSVLP